MTDVIGSTTNDRTTVTLRPDAKSGYVLALKYFAENRADFDADFRLTPEQCAVVRGFFGRIQESP